MGFIKSIKRFDLSFDVKLSTYAVPYMIGEIKRYIRDDGAVKVSRSVKELNIKIKEMQREYFYKKGKEITILQLAKELKVAKEDIIFAIEAGHTVESIESGSYTNAKDGNTISLLETLSNNIDEEEVITNKLTINELIQGLEARDKQIILLRFYKEKTQAEVARILGMTQVQVSRIERKTLDKMKKKLSLCERRGSA